MIILETQNLSHIFPDGTRALNEINLSIGDHEFIVIAGPNGSGKTVLVRHFNGLLLPTSGKVLLEGRPITEDLTRARKQVGLIFQDSDSQIVGQTVAEDVAFGPENLGLPRKEIKVLVQDSLQAVGLEHLNDHRPYTLSGGQKRRLAVAGVLAMRPKIVVFDEPFTGLDYPGVVQVLNQLLLLYQNKHTVIVVTHDLEKVLAHATRLVIMNEGSIAKDGSPEELLGVVHQYGLKPHSGDNKEIGAMTWLA